MKKYVLTVVIPICIALAVAGFLYKRYRIPPAINLPVIELTDLDGRKVSLQSYAGKPLFLNFFATWCGPCMRELPELAQLATTLSDQKLQIICICDEPIEKLQPLQLRIGRGITILHSQSKFHDMGIYTYPTNYIYDQRGKKVYEKVNPDDWTSPDVINQIRELIR
jgi:thiol-disulfide isomerase/thioredoxin